MRFIGARHFYSNSDIPFEWTSELYKLFSEIKPSLSKIAEHGIAYARHCFHITVDASLFSLGALLFQPNTDNKVQGIFYNSRVLTTQEKELSTYDLSLFPNDYLLSLALNC